MVPGNHADVPCRRDYDYKTILATIMLCGLQTDRHRHCAGHGQEVPFNSMGCGVNMTIPKASIIVHTSVWSAATQESFAAEDSYKTFSFVGGHGKGWMEGICWFSLLSFDWFTASARRAVQRG